MPHSHLLLACLVFLFYGSFQAAAAPAPKDCLTDCIDSTRLLTETVSSTTSATKHLGEELCTRATVTVISTEISVTTKTHTVTERVVGPTRMGPRACIDCTPSIKHHSTSTTTHKKTTTPALAITRRDDERGECKECLTAGIVPALLNVKTTSTTTSKPSRKKSSKTKSHTTPTTTSWAIIHSIHFDKETATALPGHPRLEDAPTHGEKRNKCVEYINSQGQVVKGC
jgi:hypothetical protein